MNKYRVVRSKKKEYVMMSHATGKYRVRIPGKVFLVKDIFDNGLMAHKDVLHPEAGWVVSDRMTGRRISGSPEFFRSDAVRNAVDRLKYALRKRDDISSYADLIAIHSYNDDGATTVSLLRFLRICEET